MDFISMRFRTMDNICDSCYYEAKSDLGLRIHFAKRHAKDREYCEKNGHNWFPNPDICNYRNCDFKRRWLDEFESA